MEISESHNVALEIWVEIWFPFEIWDLADVEVVEASLAELIQLRFEVFKNHVSVEVVVVKFVNLVKVNLVFNFTDNVKSWVCIHCSLQ